MAHKYDQLISFIREQFGEGIIPLHRPSFSGNEREYVMDAIDSTYVSSVGRYVDLFEKSIREYTGAAYAVATMNGTSALHIALILAGVKRNDLVITQSLSFIATCNAISYIDAEPFFVDVDMDNLGMSANALEELLTEHTYVKDGVCYHKVSNRRIAACVPMHTFGHPVSIDKIAALCRAYHIELIEDAAESLGSFYNGVHTGNFGSLGVFSLNGNKTVTSGGGGVIITNNEELGKLGKHLTTQAKVSHRWEFVHDSIGYNYRLPNLNAAMACAQLERIEDFISNKRALASQYESFFSGSQFRFVKESANARSNYWLNAILTENKEEKESLLLHLNDSGIMARPCWTPMHKLSMFAHCYRDGQQHTEWINDRLVNLPSSYRQETNTDTK